MGRLFSQADMGRYDSMEAVFASLKPPKQRPLPAPTTTPAVEYRPAQMALVQRPKRSHELPPSLLIDENFGMSLPFFKARSFRAEFVKNICAGCPDRVVFREAIERGAVVVTHDRGFADFEAYDHRNSIGTAVFFEPKGNKAGRARLNLALQHFATQIAPVMPFNRGLVVIYERDETYLGLRPTPDRPNTPVEVVRGNYVSGLH